MVLLGGAVAGLVAGLVWTFGIVVLGWNDRRPDGAFLYVGMLGIQFMFVVLIATPIGLVTGATAGALLLRLTTRAKFRATWVILGGAILGVLIAKILASELHKIPSLFLCFAAVVGAIGAYVGYRHLLRVKVRSNK